jgi:hypothetical protein
MWWGGVANRAKVPVSILRRFLQNLTARLRRAQQRNVTFSRTSLFYDSPFSTYCHQHHNHSKMPGFYAEIEARIEQALHELHDCENPNIAAFVQEFQVPVARLRARWNGCSSKQDLSVSNKRLTDDQELVLCLYLQFLDTIGTSARFPMVTSCANSILRRSHDSAVAGSGSGSESDPTIPSSPPTGKRFRESIKKFGSLLKEA